MSLFKSREFWCTTCDDNEEFDQNSMVISKLNSQSDFILIGSHAGILRIFKPSTALSENNLLSDYKPADLFIERNLNFPVLQLQVGRLVSGSPQMQIAVLHPKNFAVYSLSMKEGVTEHGNQNMINQLYEHKLRRSAANFTIGPFGGLQNRDFIVVQSLDGMLSFFEQETFVFCCFLPNFLLPNPFLYARRTDSFIISASNFFIESYSYKTLSSTGQNTNENDASGLRSLPDWTYNLSEGIIDMQYVYDGFLKESFILILGERNLYCLTDIGKLKFMKRLDYSPCCFTAYDMGEGRLMSMVISETNTLLLYQNTSLRWSAQLPILPIAIARANFERLKGALVCLSEDGKLQCSYLGTEPSLFSAPPLINQELNFEEAEKELNALNKIIKATYNNDLKLTNKNAERELTVSIDVSPHLEKCVYDHNLTESEGAMMCAVSVHLVPHAAFEEINVSVHVRNPLKAMPQAEFYQNLSDAVSFDCYIFMCEENDIASLDIDVVVSCVSSIGVPRVVTKRAHVPFNMIAKIHPHVKESQHKITLNISEISVPLGTLFNEFIGEDSLTSESNGVCFNNISGVGSPVTILLAKSSQRYRLQSDSAASLNIYVQEVIRRLKQHFSNKDNFKVSYNSSLPISELAKCINEHFEYRRRTIFLQNEVIQLGAQFRMIQKRLISKFKDKNPTPLTNLDMLLADTHKHTLEATTSLESANKDLHKSQIKLSCVLQLTIVLMKLMDTVNDICALENALSPYVYDMDQQNWEDTLDASINYLLRTTFAKSEKDKLRASHISYEEVKDISKLEKHLHQVLERLAKKGAILEIQTQKELAVSDEHGANLQEESAQDEQLLPIGSRIGESSTRALSARRSLLRRRSKVQNE